MQIDRETIKRLAIEVGATAMRENCLGGEVFPWGCEFEIEQLEAFAQAVAETERDACQMAVASVAHSYSDGSPGKWPPNKCLEEISKRKAASPVATSDTTVPCVAKSTECVQENP